MPRPTVWRLEGANQPTAENDDNEKQCIGEGDHEESLSVIMGAIHNAVAVLDRAEQRGRLNAAARTQSLPAAAPVSKRKRAD